jgi:uncharacterized protein with HEPN domain
MLENVNNDLKYCLSMINSASKIIDYAKDYDSAQAFYDHDRQAYFNSSITLLTNIGEAINKVSMQTQEKYPDIQWSQIVAFRNRIVHEYHGINTWVVFSIIRDELPALIEGTYQIINQGISTGLFDIKELELVKGNQFYNYVDSSRLEF